jgi:hypothetical protein
MTVTSLVLVQGKRIENAATAQYTSTNAKTVIDSGIVTNTTASTVTLTLWLVPSGGAAADANKIADALSIAAGATYLCPELAGKRLDSGDALWAQASAATSLSFRLDGRLVTSA